MNKDLNNDYRLIWFQHIHKAGGTTIVDLAKANNEVLYPANECGNPWSDGKVLKLWKYSEEELKAFINECYEKKVTFVCTEQALPLMDVLVEDSRVFTITCLREPLSRLKSNFYYAFHYGVTKSNTIEDFLNRPHKNIFRMDNYYIRLLTRKENATDKINEELFILAKKELEKFDYCAILEEGLSELNNILNWKNLELHSNRSSLTIKKVKKILLKKKWGYLLKRLFPPPGPDDKFIKDFTDLNRWDIQLYNQQLTKHSSRRLPPAESDRS